MRAEVLLPCARDSEGVVHTRQVVVFTFSDGGEYPTPINATMCELRVLGDPHGDVFHPHPGPATCLGCLVAGDP